MSFRSVVWRGVIAAVAISVVTPVFAQESAESLFKEGVAAAEAGQADLAYQKLSAAWKLKQTFDIAGNLGVIENALGKHRDAAEHIDFAIKNLPASAEASARADLTNLLDELKKKIGTLEINAPEGAAVELDGTALGNAPIAGDRYVDPGKHTLVGKKQGLKDGTVEIEVVAGERKAVSIELAAPVAPKVDEDSGRPLWPAFLGFGFAAAGIGVGVAGFVLSAQAGSDTDDLAAAIVSSKQFCVPEGAQPNAQCEEAVSSYGDSETFRGMGIAGMAVGGAALAVAITYMVLPDDSKAGAEKPAAAFTPWVAPGAGGFVITGEL